MSKLTVVGIGNRLYCDDGIGCELAEALSKQNKERDIDYVIGETDVVWCLAHITSPRVIILDAVQMGKEPGTIKVFRINDVRPHEMGISMHNGHLLSLLQENRMKEGLLIGIEPYELAPFYGLSKSMLRNFKKTIATVQRIISDYSNHETDGTNLLIKKITI